MAGDGEQPAGEVLHVDGAGPKAVGGGAAGVGAIGDGDREDPAVGLLKRAGDSED